MHITMMENAAPVLLSAPGNDERNYQRRKNSCHDQTASDYGTDLFNHFLLRQFFVYEIAVFQCEPVIGNMLFYSRKSYRSQATG